METARRLTLFATALGSSLAFIDATVVIVALPTIREDLGFGLSGEQWVFLAYSLALAALYLAAGGVGDRFGRRTVFVAGIAGFAAASALAGAAPDGAVLIVARALQGIAGAFMTTNSLALLREVYGRKEAGRAIGLWTSLTSAALIGGPPLGGLIVQYVSWRWVFFINLPLAVVAALLALRGTCPEREQHTVGRLDLPGAALAAVGLGLLTYGVVEGAAHGFGGTWWAFVGAAVAFVSFVGVERRVSEPMLPFELFRERNLAVANLETFFLYGALGGLFFYFTIYLQFLGFSPFAAGLANLPPSIVMILLAARVGKLADERGPRLFLTVGPLLLAAGLLLFLLMKTRTDFWRFGLPGLFLISFGLASFVAPITSTAIASAPDRFSGIASGVNQTVSRLGNLLAVAVIGLLVLVVFHSSGGDGATPLARHQHDSTLRAASVDAFRAGMGFSAGLAIVAGLVGAVGISNRDAQMSRA